MQEIKANPTVRHTTPLQLLAAFAATVAVLFVLLLGACALPAQPVLEHVYDSAQTIQQEGLYPEYFGFKLFQMDNYTDTIMLFEAAAMGEQDPLTAMMTATAYNVDNFETMAGDLAVYCERTIPLATGAQKAVQLVPFSYARYWHGYGRCSALCPSPVCAWCSIWCCLRCWRLFCGSCGGSVGCGPWCGLPSASWRLPCSGCRIRCSILPLSVLRMRAARGCWPGRAAPGS